MKRSNEFRFKYFKMIIKYFRNVVYTFIENIKESFGKKHLNPLNFIYILNILGHSSRSYDAFDIYD